MTAASAPLRSRIRALCLAAAAISLACRQPKVPEAPLTILLPGQVLSLDPNREMDMITDSVLFNVFEPLVGIDDKLRIRTMLAESWENPRPEQWRFHLRRNVRFHDGTPLTASLVRDVFLEVRRSPEFEASNFLTPVEDIVVIDEHTLDFITHRPRLLLTNLTTVYVTKRSAGGGFPPLVGTGPYQIREWSPSTRVELARYAGYWGAPPEFGEVAFESVPDAGQREARLVAGKADIIFRAPHTLAARVAPGVRFVHRKGVTVFYLGVNLRKRQGHPLDDLRVRRALHLGLDREALVRQFLHGLGSVATQPIPPDVFGYNPELPEPRRDLVQARRLLEEAGQTRGFKRPPRPGPAAARSGAHHRALSRRDRRARRAQRGDPRRGVLARPGRKERPLAHGMGLQQRRGWRVLRVLPAHARHGIRLQQLRWLLEPRLSTRSPSRTA